LSLLSWLVIAPDGCSNRAAKRWQLPLVGVVGMLNRDSAMRAFAVSTLTCGRLHDLLLFAGCTSTAWFDVG
jgi:hypothetical protein